MIKSLAISPKEDQLVALSSDLLLYSFSMKKKENNSQKRNMFSILLYPFHSDSIEGLDVCHRCRNIVVGNASQSMLGIEFGNLMLFRFLIPQALTIKKCPITGLKMDNFFRFPISRKPLIVTCSKDHTVRVWNYKTFGIELAKVTQI